MEKILKEIVDKKSETIALKSINFGINIPEKRTVPITLPDFNKGALICEIKRAIHDNDRYLRSRMKQCLRDLKLSHSICH